MPCLACWVSLEAGSHQHTRDTEYQAQLQCTAVYQAVSSGCAYFPHTDVSGCAEMGQRLRLATYASCACHLSSDPTGCMCAGSTMNLLMDIGIYGTLCKELGLEFLCALSAACNAVRGAHRSCVPMRPPQPLTNAGSRPACCHAPGQLAALTLALRCSRMMRTSAAHVVITGSPLAAGIQGRRHRTTS